MFDTAEFSTSKSVIKDMTFRQWNHGHHDDESLVATVQ